MTIFFLFLKYLPVIVLLPLAVFAFGGLIAQGISDFRKLIRGEC